MGAPAPCEEEGGILEDGTCQYGFPEILSENVRAWRIWTDANLMGYEVAFGLRGLEMEQRESEDLLVKLRVLSAEAARIKGEKMKEAEEEANRGR